jgi:hypothetical protein
VNNRIVAGMPVRCISEHAALVCAERLLGVVGYVGSVVLRRAGPSSERLDVLKAFGDVPSASEFDAPSEPATIAHETSAGTRPSAGADRDRIALEAFDPLQ